MRYISIYPLHSHNSEIFGVYQVYIVIDRREQMNGFAQCFRRKNFHLPTSLPVLLSRVDEVMQ